MNYVEKIKTVQEEYILITDKRILEEGGLASLINTWKNVKTNEGEYILG